MTETLDRYLAAPTLSEAWLRLVRRVYDSGHDKAVHVLLRIADPAANDPAIEAAAQALIDDWNGRHSDNKQMYDVLATRNTIFPASWASRHPEPADLAEYYRDRYPRLRKHDSNNRFGTYFGRIVAYPRAVKHGAAEEIGDQLSELVGKLRQESQNPGPKSSRYEVGIFSERWDTNTMSFPCLAHLSFHLHDGALHQQAIYRNEYLVGRAYGNYLGLAQLQCYIASACNLAVGEFLVTIGHLQLDGRRGAIKEMLASYAGKEGEP
jgi:thymidylate synthase